MKYLELYEKWAADDFLMPVTGLCFAFGGDRLFERMEPTGKDYDDIDENKFFKIIKGGSG